MIDRITRDGAYWFLGGTALAAQWFAIAYWMMGADVVLPAAIFGAAAGFVFTSVYGADLASAIRNRKRSRDTRQGYD